MLLRFILGATPEESYVVNAETGELVEGVESVVLSAVPEDGNKHRLTIELLNFEFGIPRGNGTEDILRAAPQPSKN